MGTCTSTAGRQPVVVPVPLPRCAQDYERFGNANVLRALSHLSSIAIKAHEAGAQRLTIKNGIVEAVEVADAVARAADAFRRLTGAAQPPPPPPSLCPPYVLTDPRDTRTQVVILDPGAEAIYLHKRLQRRMCVERLGWTRPSQHPNRVWGDAQARGRSGDTQRSGAFKSGDGLREWGPYLKRQYALCSMHREQLAALKFHAPLDVASVRRATHVHDDTCTTCGDGPAGAAVVDKAKSRRWSLRRRSDAKPDGTAPLTRPQINALGSLFVQVDVSECGEVNGQHMRRWLHLAAERTKSLPPGAACASRDPLVLDVLMHLVPTLHAGWFSATEFCVAMHDLCLFTQLGLVDLLFDHLLRVAADADVAAAAGEAGGEHGDGDEASVPPGTLPD